MEQVDDLPVLQVVKEFLEVIRVVPTERSSERIVEQRVDLPVPQVAQYAPMRQKKHRKKPTVSATAPDIPMPASAMDLDDFVALLVDNDVHISSDVMWGAIDMVVPVVAVASLHNSRCRSPTSSTGMCFVVLTGSRIVARGSSFACSSHSFCTLMDPHLGHLNLYRKREKQRKRAWDGVRGSQCGQDAGACFQGLPSRVWVYGVTPRAAGSRMTNKMKVVASDGHVLRLLRSGPL